MHLTAHSYIYVVYRAPKKPVMQPKLLLSKIFLFGAYVYNTHISRSWPRNRYIRATSSESRSQQKLNVLSFVYIHVCHVRKKGALMSSRISSNSRELCDTRPTWMPIVYNNNKRASTVSTAHLCIEHKFELLKKVRHGKKKHNKRTHLCRKNEVAGPAVSNLWHYCHPLLTLSCVGGVNQQKLGFLFFHSIEIN